MLTDPTTAGVLASFAMLGDVTLAEPGALMRFAGARVVAGTIREKVPENFPLSQYHFERGFIDMMVPRQELKKSLELSAEDARAGAGRQGMSENPLRDTHQELKGLAEKANVDISRELAELETKLRAPRKPPENEAWRRVELARHPERPTTLQYAEKIFDDFPSCTGTGPSATTWPWWAGSGSSTACRSRSSATRRART